jgi:hypothetical protein
LGEFCNVCFCFRYFLFDGFKNLTHNKLGKVSNERQRYCI